MENKCEVNKNETSGKEEIVWTNESLKEAVRKDQVKLKENKDGKAACWKKFSLVETKNGSLIFGWAVCVDCRCCVMFKSKLSDGSIKNYGTTNMTDHMKSCYASQGKQLTMAGFVKRVPGKKFSDTEKTAVKEAQVRLVVEGGTSFAFVDNPGLRSFAQIMIQIGSKHGNINVEDVLYGPCTVRDAVFNKMEQCQQSIKKQVSISSKYNAVSFCTDMTTDDINKNSYSDFTLFWVTEDWTLKHAMYKCEFFPEKHTGQNIKKFIDDTLTELNLNLTDTPCTTDKGSNIICATASKTHIDCCCHRLNTAINQAWKKLLILSDDLQQLNTFCHELVKFVNQSSGIQSILPTTLKHGGETRPWRSLYAMFSSVSESRDTLIPILRGRKKEHLVTRIDIDLLHEAVSFLSIFSSLFDVLEYANIPTLQNALPVYYTLYEKWQPDQSDSEILSLMKKQFLTALTDKFWSSLSMFHFVATYLDPTLKEFIFVTNIADREGFFKQVKESITSLASESKSSNDQQSLTNDLASCSSSSVFPAEPVNKKIKTSSPFAWFQNSTREER
jgi:hypothetical protein